MRMSLPPGNFVFKSSYVCYQKKKTKKQKEKYICDNTAWLECFREADGDYLSMKDKRCRR